MENVKSQKPIISFVDPSVSGGDYRAQRHKYLLLEEESLSLDREVNKAESEVKTLEDDKSALLDQVELSWNGLWKVMNSSLRAGRKRKRFPQYVAHLFCNIDQNRICTNLEFANLLHSIWMMLWILMVHHVTCNCSLGFSSM